MNATMLAEEIQVSVDESGPRLCLLHHGKLVTFRPRDLIGTFTRTSTKAQIVELVQDAINEKGVIHEINNGYYRPN